MSVITAVSRLAVSNLEASVAWYTEVLGRAPGFRLTEEVAEWRFADDCRFQPAEDSSRARLSAVIFAEDDFDGRPWALKTKGVKVGSIARSEQEDTALVRDPNGNRVIFAHRRRPDGLLAQAGAA